MTSAFVEQLSNTISEGERYPLGLLLEMWDSDFENCGFLLFDGTVAVMANVSESPESSWQMDTQEQVDFIRLHGPQIRAVWHTHPNNRETPSDTDDEGIAWLYKQGCPWEYIIVTEYAAFSYRYES